MGLPTREINSHHALEIHDLEAQKIGRKVIWSVEDVWKSVEPRAQWEIGKVERRSPLGNGGGSKAVE